MNTMNPARSVPVLKLERMKLMTVAPNIAAVRRLENPRRLLRFGDQAVLGNKRLSEGENEHKDNDRCREEYNKHSWYRSCG